MMGMALRFAYLISGGAPGILPYVSLKIYNKNLELRVGRLDRDLISESVEKLFYELADALDLFGEIN